MKKNKSDARNKAILKRSISHEEKIDMLFSYLQGMGPEAAKFSKEDVRTWFVTNTLNEIQVNGRRMCHIFGDCLYDTSYNRPIVGRRITDSAGGAENTADGSGGDGSMQYLQQMSTKPTSSGADTMHSPTGYESSTRPEYGHSISRPVSSNEAGLKLIQGNVTVLSRGRGVNERSKQFQSSFAAASTVQSTTRPFYSASAPNHMPFNAAAGDIDNEELLNREFGGIQNMNKLFPIPSEKDLESLEMKPLRIPPVEKWLETHVTTFCDGRVPPPIGPHNPSVLLAQLKGYSLQFVNGRPLSDTKA